jgi:hypothetical protein
MTSRSSIAGTILFILFGPIVWALHFGLSYAGHAGLCAAGDRLPLGPSALPLLLGTVTAIAAALIAAGLIAPRLLRTPLGAPREGETAAFVTTLMRLLAGLSLFGVAFMALTMLLLPLCAPLR